MKRIGIIVAALLCMLLAPRADAHEARFDWFAYHGIDAAPAPRAGQYRNPIIAGFYPDPSIVRVGSDFYLVHSSFAWFPGIPVWRSRDLVHWHRLGNAIDRPGQLDFARLGLSRGVFAPGIAWQNGRFYIVGTCVDCGGNFVITARDAAGPWSDPVWLREVEGIDPSLFFDDDGSAWLVNNRAPAGPPRYDGHRAIWLQRFDPATLRVTGAARMIVDGGVDPAAKPVWIEGPHLFKRDGHYYLSAAEGGTSINHSQVVFRADRLNDAFRPAPPAINPILTQRDLDPARPSPITSAGHVDLVRLADGRWWAVFLATRPYAGDLYNIGRETFLLPVTWRDGWPIILPHGAAIPRVARAPALPRDAAPPTSGSFAYRDGFDAARLDPAWLAIRGPAAARLGGGQLGLVPGDALGGAGRPAFVGRRQVHDDAMVTTALRFVPMQGERAGIAAVQSDDALLALAVTRGATGAMVQVTRRDGSGDPPAGRLVVSVALPRGRGLVLLRIHLRAGRADFAVARGGIWRTIAAQVDATNLSTARAGGFVGTVIGPFADRAGP